MSAITRRAQLLWFQALILAPALCTAVWLCPTTAAAASGKHVLAGWFGVFPDLAGYQRTFHAPVVLSSTSYRQTVTYLWTGNADRTWELTLSRDPALLREYAPGHVPRLPDEPSPTLLHLHGYAVWLWDLSRSAGSNRKAVRWRLVIVLARDRIAQLEAHGYGPFEDPTSLARMCRLKAMRAALNTTPRTHFDRTLQPFRILRKGISYQMVTDWVGPADSDIGSGIHVLVYNLADRSRVLLGFPDFDHMLYAYHQRTDGTMEVIVGPHAM